MQSLVNSVEEQELDTDLAAVAFGLEDGGETVELDPTVINDEIRLLEELEVHTVGWGNPFKDLRDVLLERGGQPHEATS